MKGVNYIWFLISAWFILLVAGCSSDYDLPEVKEKPKFVMYIYLPEQEAMTRGEKDIDADDANENVIKSVQVWVFPWKKVGNELVETTFEEGECPENRTSIGSLYVSLSNLSLTGGVKEVAFYGIPEDFKTKYPNLDVYAVVNAASAGISGLDATTTKAQLEEKQITGTNFGIDGTSSKPLVTSVDPAKGLPMSGYVKQAPVSKQNETYSITNVDVKRAVSKIRFVFSRATNITASVTELKLDGHVVYSDGHTYQYVDGTGNVIPESEYLFSGVHDGGDVSSTFLHVINFNVPVTVPSHDNPWQLRWEDDETRQEWEDKINLAIKEGTAVECGRAYLRESPYRLTGTIKYKFQQEGESELSHSARFTMVDENEFLRNHSWTIYAYFSEGGVVFEVDGWEKQQVTFIPFI